MITVRANSDIMAPLFLMIRSRTCRELRCIVGSQQRFLQQVAFSSSHSSSSSPSSSSSSSTATTSSFLRRYIYQFNNTVTTYPIASLGSFLAMRTFSWYFLFYFFFSLPFSPPPELGIGYIVTKFTSKFRQPLNLGLAALLAKCFPILSTVHASSLLGILPLGISAERTAEESEKLNKMSTRNRQRLLLLESYLQRGHDWLTGSVNQYGLSLYLSSKVNVQLTILLTALAVKMGVDMPTMLNYFDISGALQNGGGSMALATLTNAVLLPGHFLLLSAVAPVVGERFGEKAVGPLTSVVLVPPASDMGKEKK